MRLLKGLGWGGCIIRITKILSLHTSYHFESWRRLQWKSYHKILTPEQLQETSAKSRLHFMNNKWREKPCQQTGSGHISRKLYLTYYKSGIKFSSPFIVSTAKRTNDTHERNILCQELHGGYIAAYSELSCRPWCNVPPRIRNEERCSAFLLDLQDFRGCTVTVSYLKLEIFKL